MSASLASFKRSVTIGTRLLCVENTYRPEISGTYRTVVKAAGSFFESKLDGDPRAHRTDWPKSSVVYNVTDDEITFGLDQTDHYGRPVERLAGHKVTLRIVRDADR